MHWLTSASIERLKIWCSEAECGPVRTVDSSR